MGGDVTGKRTSGDSSPSITAPLVSTWMTFGEGNDVDVAIVGIGYVSGYSPNWGRGAEDNRNGFALVMPVLLLCVISFYTT